MSGLIQPNRRINHVFPSYLVENNEGRLLTPLRPCPSVRRKLISLCLSIYVS